MIEDIYNNFINSNKKHLIITGSLNSGKSYSFNEIASRLDITTLKTMYFDNKNEKILKLAFNDNWDNATNISIYNYHLKERTVNTNVFSNKVISELNNANTEWIGIDEIGFLEASEVKYSQMISQLLEIKSMLLVLRKDKNTELLNKMRNLEDAFYVDLDQYKLDISCVVMASGFSRRFNANKLLTYIDDLTMIEMTLKQIPYSLFKEVIIVTRYEQVKTIASKYNVKCIIHDDKYQSDTVKHGLNNISETSGVMFLTADQPLRTKESLIKMIYSFRNDTTKIIRLAYEDKVGNPVVFPSSTFDELLSLEQDKGGNSILENHQQDIIYVEALNEYELIDVDTQDDLIVVRNLLEKNKVNINRN